MRAALNPGDHLQSGLLKLYGTRGAKPDAALHFISALPITAWRGHSAVHVLPRRRYLEAAAPLRQPGRDHDRIDRGPHEDGRLIRTRLRAALAALGAVLGVAMLLLAPGRAVAAVQCPSGEPCVVVHALDGTDEVGTEVVGHWPTSVTGPMSPTRST